MPVNFFDAHHTQSEQEKFGLFDESHPVRKPSYIMESEKDEWIGIVQNPNRIKADFYGLDHSLQIPLPPPNPDNKYIESLCDGMLQHRHNLAFVELKVWESNGKWIGKSTDQIINSIRLFAANHDIEKYDKIDARICNKLKPALHLNCVHSKEKFRELARELHFKGDLTVKQEIVI